MQYGIDRGEFEPGNTRQVTIAIGPALEGTLLLWAYAPEMVNTFLPFLSAVIAAGDLLSMAPGGSRQASRL